MVDTLTSRTALAVSMPPVAEPTDDIEVRLLYDPFRPDTVEKHTLDYQDGVSLLEYLGDLPEEGEYMVFHNGQEVELDDAGSIVVNKGDRIGLIVLPQGGGVKSILRVVMMAAFIAVGAYLFGLPGIIAGSIIGGRVSNFLFAPKIPKSQDRDEKSYGIDGAKNSATEGIPYPIVYGEFRTAGNFADTYTENVGDNQFLYLRSVINDGEIDSVSDIEINEQSVENFRSVETRLKKGTLAEDVNDWFRSSIRQTNKGIKLDTNWTTHVTTQVVDQVRFDLVFPAGLVSISEKKGTYRSKSVTFEMEFRRVEQNPTTGDWEPVAGAEGEYDTLPHVDNNQDVTRDSPGGIAGAFFTNAAKVKVVASAPTTSTLQNLAVSSSQGPAVEYRPSGGAWTRVAGWKIPTGNQGYVPDAQGDGTISGPTNITPRLNGEFEIELDPNLEYEFRGANGAEVERVITYPESGRSSITVTDSRSRAIRRSFTSARLAKGYYEVRIRRTNAQSNSNYEIDEVVLTDVSEIEADPVAMRGTANLSLRIKLDEQLNQIPQLTAKVKGSLLQEYDRDGNPTVRRWSANPAWIGLDILCGVERGAGIALSRIDWPRWVEYAEWCDANNIQFNGVFAEGTNIGDALRQVLRIGHAAPVPFGTRISVAVDRARDPVTMFTQASMVAKSFSITYMSMQDRSNEFEVTYYDKTDRNKAKTIRYVDPKAVTFNEMPRSSSITLVGVDNVVQAKAELWRAVYQNRLLIRQVSFEAFMESINLNIGEVALIQHDQMDWANNGRLKAGSSPTVINLDQRVEMEDGQSYSTLVHFSAIRRMEARTVSSVIGNRVLIDTAGQAMDAGQMKSVRMVCSNGEDIEITKLENGSSYHTITLATAPEGIVAGDTVELWETDVVEERDVSSVTQNSDGTTSVTVSSAFPVAPDQFANFVFGKVERVRKPYVLTGVSGNGMEKRKLTFMEYHEGVYAPAEVDIPIPVGQVNDRTVEQVNGLLFDYDRVVDANRKTVGVRLYWTAGTIRNYGGADIYMRHNGGDWTAVGSAVNVTEWVMQLTPDDEVEFKVVAYNTHGDRAPVADAPSVSGTLSVSRATLDPPTDLAASVVRYELDGVINFTWVEPEDASGVEFYELEYKADGAAEWISAGTFTGTFAVVPGIDIGDYDVRLRSGSANSESDWVSSTFSVVHQQDSARSQISRLNQYGRAVDAFTFPPIVTFNKAYYFSGDIDYVANDDGTATVTMSNSVVTSGSSSVAYSTMSASVSGGTPGTSVTYQLYVTEGDNPSDWGGAKTLQMSSSPLDVMGGSNNIWLGSVAIAFPTTGSSSGTGTGGGADRTFSYNEN